MYYTYILQSKNDGSYYIGVTSDLKKRLKEHNSGKSKYTSKKTPYVLKWYCCFVDKNKAYIYETYLKSSSGYAYWKKRFV
ncbi:MAG: GIY-YIG nuclease family protein [Candidatus Paceibacterota bacterium]